MRPASALRCIVVGVIGVVTLTVAAPQPARADITDLFQLLRPNFPQAPRTLAESAPRHLLLNGFPLRMLSGRTPETPQQVLDFYEQRSRQRSRGAVPTPVFRREGQDFGILLAADGDGEELLRQMVARRLHYVHLAPLCMVFAQRAGELTTYLAISSDTPMPAQVLSPTSGQEAPGSDVPGVPRPAGSLRSFSLSEPAAGYVAVSYIVDQPPENAFASTVEELRAAGFTVDASFGTAARASGTLTLRLERGRQDLLISAVPHQSGAQRSLIMYVTRSL